MHITEFRSLLIDACLVAASADGSVDQVELTCIRNAMVQTFVGDDAVSDRLQQLDYSAESFRCNFARKFEACLEQVRSAMLTMGQRRRLLDLCCRIIRADGVVDHAEVKVLRELVEAVSTSISEAERLCPEHAGLFRLLSHDGEHGFRRPANEHLDFGDPSFS